MRSARILVIAASIVWASACGEDSAPPQDDPGSSEVIQELAHHERSVEDFDVCAALRAARTAEELQELLGADSAWFDDSFRDNDDGIVRTCSVTGEKHGDVGLGVYLIQGTEHVGAEDDDPVVFPGCRAPHAESRAGTTSYRISCEPYLFVDAAVTRIDMPAVDTNTLEDLLQDVLVAVSQQG